MFFNGFMDKLKKELGIETQTELAKILDISQGNISEAKKRDSIPAEWLVKLCRSHRLNPMWLADGIEPKYINEREPLNQKKEAQIQELATRATIIQKENKNEFVRFYNETGFPEILYEVLTLEAKLYCEPRTEDEQIEAIKAFSYKDAVDFKFLKTILLLTDNFLGQVIHLVDNLIYPKIRVSVIVRLYSDFYSNKKSLNSEMVMKYVKDELSDWRDNFGFALEKIDMSKIK